MFLSLNGTRLYFDVEGAGLVPDGASMRERPTLLLLHGGPGADHTLYKPAFSALSDVAQVIYLDHRGNGRSDAGDPRDWNLAQWGDDVRAFCDALGIVKPVVYGASFGGMVAMSYATRHPGHAGKLVLVSTMARWHSRNDERVAMFRRLGGNEAGELAHRRFVGGDTSPEVLAAWLRVCVPLYTRSAHDADAWARMASRPDATAWFNRSGIGEAHHFNFVPQLCRVTEPTLLMAGTLDPMTPVQCQHDLVGALTAAPTQAIEFDGCGHGVVPDAPDRAFAELRRFMLS